MKVERRIRLPALVVAIIGAALLATACGAGAKTSSDGAVSNPGDGPDLGVIAYINTHGCIERVSATTGQPAGPAYCAASRTGVTSVTWIDANSVAYATSEAQALGWQRVRFDTGVSETMPIAEAPRVLLIPPQYYSSKGERMTISPEGLVALSTTETYVPVFPPGGKSPDASTRLVAWSPDGEWVLLSTSTDKELWVVGRTGANPHRIATESKGVAAWFMPEVGATPHADLTCSVITDQSWGCEAPLRYPGDRATVKPDRNGIVDFLWSGCPGATGYLFEIYSAGSDAPVVSGLVVGTFWHQSASELPPGELRWRVRALIGVAEAPWAERTVTIADPGT